MACSVCGSSDQKLIIDFGEIPLCDDIREAKVQALYVPQFPVKVLSCSACNHSELQVKPPEELIYSNYTYRTSLSPLLDDHFYKYSNAILDFAKQNVIPVEEQLFLDVGGNDGLLASIMSRKGFHVSVVDPSPTSIFCPKNVKLYNTYLTPDVAVDFVSSNGQADVISCNNCIANIRDLQAFAQSISLLLREGGLLCIETGYLKHQLESRTAEMINHEHFHYFTINSLSKLFNNVGISIIDWEFIGTKGGSIRFFGKKSSGLSNYLLPMLDEELDCLGFNRFIEARKLELLRICDHNNVGFFGSSAGSTILCYVFELDSFIDRVVDDNVIRHGKFMPGTGAVIVSPQMWYDDPTLITINFAWRFGDLIRAKHKCNLPNSSSIVDVVPH
jgi:2-polyprenyl-3-methyl-5-hydroxy-6-metoxy-1,4-benzoquinol methylase